MSKRNVYITSVVVVAIAVTTYGLLAWLLPGQKVQIPASIKQHVAEVSNLIVVLPSTLPANSTLISGPEYDSQKKTIITSFNIDGKDFVVSQQKRPGTALEQIDAEDTFLINAGSVYVLKGEPGRLQAIVETSDSWLMVNGDSGIGVTVFKNLLETFERV